MPPRLSLWPLASACQSCATQSNKAFISSSAPRPVTSYTASNASRELLDVDNNSSKRPPPPSRASAQKTNEMMNAILQKTNAYAGMATSKEEAQERRISIAKREELARFASRRWKAGDVYSPHDLSPDEMLKWSEPQKPTKDIIDILGINPLDHYKNFSIISEYMTEMGRIKPARMTGLRPVNQRKMAKAIRRAVGMGIHPSTHRHPMILYSQVDLKDFADLKAVAARQAAAAAAEDSQA